MIRRIVALAATAGSLAGAATAGSVDCGDGVARVTAPDTAVAEQTCRAAVSAFETLSGCGIDAPEASLDIAVTDAVPKNCLGIYHCGEGQIEVLPPAAMGEGRKIYGLLAPLPLETLYSSVVAHEIGHAVFDRVNCTDPSGCLVTSEYFAYVMQLASLTPAQLSLVEAEIDMGRDVGAAYLNAPLLAMAPSAFAKFAWVYANRDGDVCKELRAVLSGDVYFPQIELQP